MSSQSHFMPYCLQTQRKGQKGLDVPARSDNQYRKFERFKTGAGRTGEELGGRHDFPGNAVFESLLV